MVTTVTRKAYSEVDEFLELLNDEDREKIPQKLRNFFKEEKDKNYTKGIILEKTIEEQNLLKETLAIIAFLNLQYWCESEEEKQRLMSIYNNNEKKYQEELREKYNPDNLFKKETIITDDAKIQTTQMIEYRKENLFTKIINIIKSIFKKI